MKNTSPKISVVIPAYNEEDYIAACLKAIQKQTIRPFEIIVIDNNSTDRTSEIAKSFRGVRVLSQPKPGIEATRSFGFDKAKGDIIARTDADTRPDPNWLERIKVSMMAGHDAVTGPVYYFDMPAQQVTKKAEIAIRGELAKSPNQPSFLAGANMAISRKVWVKVRSKTCKHRFLHEDLDLAIHLEQEGFSVGFNRKMLVATSARRMSGNTRNFYHYMKAYERTYYHHDIRSFAIKIPLLMYLPMQPVLRIIRKAYDPDIARMSLRKLVSIGEY